MGRSNGRKQKSHRIDDPVALDASERLRGCWSRGILEGTRVRPEAWSSHMRRRAGGQNHDREHLGTLSPSRRRGTDGRG
jgi:hypothetical protein